MNTAIAHSFCKTTAQQAHKCYAVCHDKKNGNQYEECLRTILLCYRKMQYKTRCGSSLSLVTGPKEISKRRIVRDIDMIL